MAGRVWARGDTHADFDFLPYFCDKYNTDVDDILIILGDAGILYYGENEKREQNLKDYLTVLPITLVCVRGNHEDRSTNRSNMETCTIVNKYYCGTFDYEPGYENILYTHDGYDYMFGDKLCLVVGGAYSVDKWLRIQMGYKWFVDEELTDKEMEEIKFNTKDKKYDYVFTHTCPYEWEPTDLFLSFIDQNTVSERMEKFLSELTTNFEWDKWMFGHFHADRMDVCGDGKVSMLYNQEVQIV